MYILNIQYIICIIPIVFIMKEYCIRFYIEFCIDSTKNNICVNVFKLQIKGALLKSEQA